MPIWSPHRSGLIGRWWGHGRQTTSLDRRMGVSVIEVDALVMVYAGRRVVDEVSFGVQPGSVMTLLGPNGAGKTTTVETLEGYRVPTAGRVRVLGLDPVADAKALAPRIGVMLQRNGVYLTMGPGEVLRLFAAYYGSRALDPLAMLERVGLLASATTPWRRLSGGEQQRLSLALALIGRPEVVFLDEPTAAIDASARLAVREIVASLREDGVAVLLTTHDLDEAERLSDHIVIIDHGRVVARGTPDQLMRTGGDEIRFGAPAGLDVAGLATHLDASVNEIRPGNYIVATAPTPSNVAALTAWLATRDLPLADLRAGRQSLEDVFLRLTSRADEPKADEPIADGFATTDRSGRAARRGRR